MNTYKNAYTVIRTTQNRNVTTIYETVWYFGLLNFDSPRPDGKKFRVFIYFIVVMHRVLIYYDIYTYQNTSISEKIPGIK